MGALALSSSSPWRVLKPLPHGSCLVAATSSGHRSLRVVVEERTGEERPRVGNLGPDGAPLLHPWKLAASHPLPCMPPPPSTAKAAAAEERSARQRAEQDAAAERRVKFKRRRAADGDAENASLNSPTAAGAAAAAGLDSVPRFSGGRKKPDRTATNAFKEGFKEAAGQARENCGVCCWTLLPPPPLHLLVHLLPLLLPGL